jgi:hypothetical protein
MQVKISSWMGNLHRIPLVELKVFRKADMEGLSASEETWETGHYSLSSHQLSFSGNTLIIGFFS